MEEDRSEVDGLAECEEGTKASKRRAMGEEEVEGGGGVDGVE